jgi:hypothetical protein
MKTIHVCILFLLALIGKCFGQTNVNGGIYSNTTWNFASSPYVVTDTVVVFPGVTLTIEPGVTILFDSSQFLEIRQARLIANGTMTNPITFTSNSVSPFPGIYKGVNVNAGYGSQISFCNFSYANSIYGGDTIRNCTAMFNVDGLQSLNLIDSCIIRNCTGTGALSGEIKNCIITNNNIGAEPGFNLINCIIDSSITTGVKYNGGGSGIISHCIVRYDSIGLGYGNYNVDSCIITHHKFGIIITNYNVITNSVIDSNFIGILNGRYQFMGSLAGTGGSISNCEINYNSTGIYTNTTTMNTGGLYTITNCDLKYNGTGISDLIGGQGHGNIITTNRIENDSIGIFLSGGPDSISCNSICNNVTYGFKYNGTNNINATNNYWCTFDSTSAENFIFDGYDDVTYGLVFFMPIDSSCSLLTSIDEPENTEAVIYPNPATSYVIIDSRFEQVRMFNLIGKEIATYTLPNGNIDITKLADGIYILEMKESKGVARGKVIKKTVNQ